MLRQAFPLLLVATLSQSVLSSGDDDPFVGKWKLNGARSKLVDQMKVESAGPNKYALNFSGPDNETIVADGTDQPGLNGTTVSISNEAPDRWKVVRKKEGRTLLTGIWELSEDGNSLSDHYTEYKPDGSTSLSVDYLYTRTAGTSGFAGTWLTTSDMASADLALHIQPWEGDGLSFISVNEHSTQNMKFDGKDYPESGPYAVAGLRSSGRRVDNQTLEITDKIKGVVTRTRQLKVSPDRKMLMMTMQSVGQSAPSVLVFDRQ